MPSRLSSFKRSIPNAMTLFRIAAIPVVCLLVFVPYAVAAWSAFALYVAAAISDFLDGYLARKWNSSSDFGRVLDPIADKLLVAALLLCLAGNGALYPFGLVPAIVIVLRELLVSGLREYLAPRGVVLPVSRLAKWKTATQLVAMGLLLLGGLPHLYWAGIAALWIAAGLTAWTGWQYLRATLASAEV